MTIEEIIDNFMALDSPEEKYTYLIELGQYLMPLAKSEKTESNQIKSCISTVWISLKEKDGKLNIKADSDAMIIKGILMILISIFENKTKEERNNIDAHSILEKMKLEEILSQGRRTGLQSMIDRIKKF